MDRETKFNILRGIVMCSYLENEEKKELVEFVNELEDGESIDFLEPH